MAKILFLFLILSNNSFSQTKINTRNESWQSLFIEVYKDNRKMATATGFIIKSKSGKNYLITNYHVLTLKNPITDKYEDTITASPNRIAIHHNGILLGKHVTVWENLLDKNGK